MNELKRCEVCGGMSQVKSYEWVLNGTNKNPSITLCANCQLLCLDVLFQALGAVINVPIIIRKCNKTEQFNTAYFVKKEDN